MRLSAQPPCRYGFLLPTLILLVALGGPLGCPAVDNADLPLAETFPPGDDDSHNGDDDSKTGDDDTAAGDDDTRGGDDDTLGDDDTIGDDDTSIGDDDTLAGDDDTSVGDDDSAAGDDDTLAGDDDTSSDFLSPTPEQTSPTPISDFDEDGDGYSPAQGDCDDNDNSIHPGAEETCDQQDQNCDGQADESLSQDWYADSDGDGYGDMNDAPTQSCTQPAQEVANNDDCADEDSSIHPGAEDICNNQTDDDCDGEVDEGSNVYYHDQDLDGFGDPNSTTTACAPPEGYVENDYDCRDTNDMVHPGATELCNEIDDDCDGEVDEGLGDTFYADGDQDGYGDASVQTLACFSAPQGYVSDDQDCDDTNAAVHPGATEVSNGIDDDCDGIVDFPVSCEEQLQLQPASPSAVYTIDPDGSGGDEPFDVYCEMDMQDGGWTLLAVITNGDGDSNWEPKSGVWVTGQTFGASTDPDTRADAKSPAYEKLPTHALMIVKGNSEVEVVTDDSCMEGYSLRSIMRRDSSSSRDCAWSCTTVVQTGVWDGDGCQTSSQLNFRCMDGEDTYKINGYDISESDNSFITTLDNNDECYDDVFGLGVAQYNGEHSSHADFIEEVASNPSSPDDDTPRQVYGR